MNTVEWPREGAKSAKVLVVVSLLLFFAAMPWMEDVRVRNGVKLARSSLSKSEFIRKSSLSGCDMVNATGIGSQVWTWQGLDLHLSLVNGGVLTS